MHVCQGVLTHQNGETFLQLNKEDIATDEENFFITEAEACLQQFIPDAEKLSASEEFQHVLSEHQKLLKKMKSIIEAIGNAVDENDQQSTEALEDEKAELDDAIELLTSGFDFETKNRMVRGAKEIEALIDSGEEDMKKRMTKPTSSTSGSVLGRTTLI